VDVGNRVTEDTYTRGVWVIRALAAYAVIGGILTLIGWYAGLPRLTDWPSSGISMFANTAAEAILTGTSLLLSYPKRNWSTKLSGILGVAVACIAVVILLQHILQIDLGIDTLLVKGNWGEKAAVSQGRMGPPACISFTLLGVAMALRAWAPRAQRIVPFLGIAASAIASLALMGYIFDADPLYSIAHFTGIAMQSASIILALGIGVIACAPEQQPVRMLRQNSSAGLLARRALPVILILPVLVGCLRVWGEANGYFDAGMGTALLVMTLVIFFFGLLWWCVTAIAEHESLVERVSRLPRENPAPVIRLTEGHTVSYANSAAEKMLSYWNVAMNGEAPPAVTEVARGTLATGEKSVLEISLGETIYEVSVVPVTAENYVNLYFTDVSDRKRAQEALLAADRRKDEFVAVVSHELRTPLTSIYGWVKLINGGKISSEQLAHGMKVIERNIQAQMKLVEDLLDMSRIVAGKMSIKPRRVDVKEIVDAAIESLRPALQAREMELNVRVEPLSIWADADRVQQVIWNLLSNAIKFTPPRGAIELSVSHSENLARIVVRDNGRGMSPEFLPHVFNRFEQADASSTRNTGGLGLGLAIARYLVELHGGSISAESAGEGKGCAFTVELPMRGAAELDGKPPRQTRHVTDVAPSLRGVRVLLVEDEADTREMLDMALRSGGAETIVAGGAREGFERFQQQRPNVVVCDIAMPGEDGYSLAARIRALDQNGQRTALIALTAFAREEDRQRAVDGGFDIFLSKPIQPDALVRAVTAAVRGEIEISAQAGLGTNT
jgi:signal transduction histidine kinase/CheY-like chemotaxis protein